MRDIFTKIVNFLRRKVFRPKGELVKPKPLPKPVPKPSKVSVTGITLDKTAVNLKDHTEVKLKATVMPSNATNKEIDWTSSNINVATVNQDGWVTGISMGRAVITAKTKDGGYEATCIVNPDFVPVTGITLDKTAVSISHPQGFLLRATIQPANATNKEIDWTSSSIKIATVTHWADDPCQGSATGIAPGTAIIKAKTMDGGYEATCKVTVQ